MTKSVFIYFILVFIFSQFAYSFKLEDLYSVNSLTILSDSDVTLDYVSSEDADLNSRIQRANLKIELGQLGQCLLSTSTKDNRAKILSKSSMYKARAQYNDVYNKKEFLINVTHENSSINLQLKCFLELKSSNIIFVDFATDDSKNVCKKKGGDSLIEIRDSMLRLGGASGIAKFPYIVCMKRVPKISKEQFVSAFQKVGIKLTVDEKITNKIESKTGAPPVKQNAR